MKPQESLVRTLGDPLGTGVYLLDEHKLTAHSVVHLYNFLYDSMNTVCRSVGRIAQSDYCNSFSHF